MYEEKMSLLLHACITYGHLGYLNLEDHELVCLYEECFVIAQYFGDVPNVIQSYLLLDELNKKMHCFEGLPARYVQILIPETTNCEEVEAACFMLMAKRYAVLKNPQKAIEYYQKSINMSRNLGLKEIEGYAHCELGQIYNKLHKFNEMKECSEQCIKLGKEIGNKELEGIGYSQSGIANCWLNNLEEAISSSKRSIEIALQTGKTLLMAEAYGNLGAALSKLGKFDQAQSYLEKSLEIAKKEGSREGESNSYRNLAVTCRLAGKPQEAINYYEKFLSISKDIGEKAHEGQSYYMLGDLYHTQGKLHDTMECLDKGHDVFKDIGRRRMEGEMYTKFAGLYSSVGKSKEALEHLEKSLEIAIETGDKKSEMKCYGALAELYRNLNQPHEAVEYFRKFLCCSKELSGSDEIQDPTTLVYVHITMGSFLLLLNEPGEAVKLFEKSLEVATSTNSEGDKEITYFYLGEAYFHMKKHREAIKYLEESLNVTKNTGNKRIAENTSHKLGKVYYDLSVVSAEKGDEEKSQDAKQKSEEMLKKALEFPEWKFTQLKDLSDFKISIVDTFIHTYKLLTKVLIERQKTDEALLISDRGRARSLGDILVSKYGVTEERALGQPPLDSTGLESVLSSNQYCILFFAVGDQDLHAWVLTHQQPIVFVSTNKQAVKALQFEGHSNIKLNLQQITINVVNQFYCKMPREMETARRENRSFDSTEDSKFPSEGGEVQPKKTGMKSGERNVDSDDETQNETDQKTDQLEVLFSLLITPVMQHLQHEEIVIIPDGHLFMVPFAALRDPTTGKYLSETKSIRISPSLATLKALQESTGHHHSKTGALIVGNPDVGKVMFKGEAKEFDPLPSAEKEADSIAKLLNVKPLTGSQATKEMVKQKLREGVAVIHIAAHGDSEHGHIALAPPPTTDATRIPEEQDYMLTMQEVQEIGVTAQLVVLSCCHSGRGDIKAEGVVGMSRAFLAAGARAVVASLWAVDDYATSRFMISFYTSLKMGESASKSLQIAMEDIREEDDPDDPSYWTPSSQRIEIKDYSEPQYWAPFFLIGDDVTISV